MKRFFRTFIGKAVLFLLCLISAVCTIGGTAAAVYILGSGMNFYKMPEQEILKGYFDEIGKNGFDYAYQYPGMNKVMQAAGRVIRTMEDKGVILLLDDRFLRSDYQAMFPKEWWPHQAVNHRTAGELMEMFWK